MVRAPRKRASKPGRSQTGPSTATQLLLVEAEPQAVKPKPRSRPASAPRAKSAPKPRSKPRPRAGEPVPAEPTPAASPPAPARARAKGRSEGAAPRRRTAQELASGQREISVSEFFTKNRHLLGFDNPAKALLTTVKEAVDNSFDACEEAGILPEITISIYELSDTRYRVAVEDNGPGIVRQQIPKVFGQLLYGSKFHRLRQSLIAQEPVLIERQGRVERIPIGRLVDGVLGDGDEVRDVTDLGWRVPAFDPATWKYDWRPVSHVIRHRRENEILEIRTECGKRVRVTGCHSLFTFASAAHEVRAVAARSLEPDDCIIAPRRLAEPAGVETICLLSEVQAEDLAGRAVFVYGLPLALLRSLREGARAIHKKSANRSRRYLRLAAASGGHVDVLDDSWRQYESQGFLPARLVKRLGLETEATGVLRTYRHGVPCEMPSAWPLTPALMRFLGLYVAEGHSDRRQIAFTFGSGETELVDDVMRTARFLGLSASIEERPRHAVRVKVFGGIVDRLMPAWCGRGARSKRVPWFVFHASHELRQCFLDGLYRGDGHRVKGRDVLMFGSASRELIADVEALWLLQGVVASRSGPYRQRGLGREPSTSWRLDVHGSDIATASALERRSRRRAWNRYRMFPVEKFGMAGAGAGSRVTPEVGPLLRAAGLGLGSAGGAKSVALIEGFEEGHAYDTASLSSLAQARVTRHLANHLVSQGYLEAVGQDYVATHKAEELRNEIDVIKSFAESDLCLLRVREIREVTGDHPFVYDLSVPGCENFVAGEGFLACHNSRGQQGIGISAAGMYGQLTTGKPISITSRTGANRPAHHFQIQIDTRKNLPVIARDEEVAWECEHGTRVELEIEATYKKGRRSVDGYIEMTALANPHATIVYHSPKGEVMRFERATTELPREPKEIKPHPHGVELGILMKMLKDTRARNVHSFLTGEFSRVSAKAADEILGHARLAPTTSPARVHRDAAEALFKAIGAVKMMAPPTNCLSPIGDEALSAGLEQQGAADFVTAVTRPPAVYRGNPFQVEVGIAYGGERPADELAELVRFANRVPLLYQQSACAITRGVLTTSWRSYGIQQSKGALPSAPMLIMVHIASAWVPFTSESKEAIAQLPGDPEGDQARPPGVRPAARRLHPQGEPSSREAALKRSYIEKYIPHIGIALREILSLSEREETKVVDKLKDTLERSRTPL